jgi:diketogulonate reductase-like aldo/keto reductase
MLDEDQPQLLKDEAIAIIAKKYDKTPAQVILRWAVQRGTIAIPKSVTPSRIDENIAIFDFELSEKEMDQINDLDQSHRFVNPLNWGFSYFD